MAPPPPDGSRGCVATIRRLMQGVGHTVPCNTSRQAALQARWVGWVGTGERYNGTVVPCAQHRFPRCDLLQRGTMGPSLMLVVLVAPVYAFAVASLQRERRMRVARAYS